MCRLRPFFSSLLILLLVAGTTAMASTQGGMRDSVGTMILCTGTQTLVVHIDADGVPIEAAHHCPECAVHVAFDVGKRFELAVPLRKGMQTAAFTHLQLKAAPHRLSASARSPPFV